MSFITINTIITEITVITNIKILNAKWSKIEVPMNLSSSFSLSKVSCCLLKLYFLCLYFLTSSLNVSGADNNSLSKSSDSVILVKYGLVLLYYGKMEYLMYLFIYQNNLKMLYLPQSTFPNLHCLFLDHMLQWIIIKSYFLLLLYNYRVLFYLIIHMDNWVFLLEYYCV